MSKANVAVNPAITAPLRSHSREVTKLTGGAHQDNQRHPTRGDLQARRENERGQAYVKIFAI
jgi:hypothetical protein